MRDDFYSAPFRDTQLEPRFFFLNYRVLVLLLIVLLVPQTTIRIITSLLVLALMIFLRLGESRGLTPTRALRAVRAALAGRLRPSRDPALNRKAFDAHLVPHPFIPDRKAP